MPWILTVFFQCISVFSGYVNVIILHISHKKCKGHIYLLFITPPAISTSAVQIQWKVLGFYQWPMRTDGSVSRQTLHLGEKNCRVSGGHWLSSSNRTDFELKRAKEESNRQLFLQHTPTSPSVRKKWAKSVKETVINREIRS